MHKTVYRPQSFAGYSRAVVIEHPTHTQVAMAGVIATDDEGNVVGGGDMKTQTRHIYQQIEDYLAEFDGGLEDVIRHRVFVTTMDDSAVDEYHAAHCECFDEPALFPAGTLVEIDSLVLDDAMIEIEIEAVIPHDGWETEVTGPA